MKVGQRVFVDTPLFSGVGVVNYIASSKEIYPIQVELDEPSFDGHKLKRVAANEIKPIEQPQRRKKFLAEVNKNRLGYIIGERYIITEKDADGYYAVYLVKRPDHAPVGSYKSNFFKILLPFDEEVAEKRTEHTKFTVLPDKSNKKTFKEENATEGKIKPNKRMKKKDLQMTIFEFLEG